MRLANSNADHCLDFWEHISITTLGRRVQKSPHRDHILNMLYAIDIYAGALWSWFRKIDRHASFAVIATMSQESQQGQPMVTDAST